MALLLSKINFLTKPSQFFRLSVNVKQYLSSDTSSGDLYPPPAHIVEPWIPPYVERTDEPTELKKARLYNITPYVYRPITKLFPIIGYSTSQENEVCWRMGFS